MKTRRGVSLLELLVVAVMSAIITAGAVRAFNSGIEFQTTVVPRREAQLERHRFEDGISKLLKAAYVSTNEQDATTYFVAGSSSGETGGLSEGVTADTLVFTILGLPPTASYMNSEDEFETKNEVFGPQGGAAEIQLSTVPVGDAGEHTGLFVREQRPADGMPFEGGYESVWSDLVASIFFEFWNGETWVAEWDTLTQGERRLPAAVRVTYSFVGDESQTSFVVRIPLSDVTPDNPLGVGGGDG